MEKEQFVKIPKWVARNSEISPLAKALYLALKSYNPIFPSYSRLCRDTGINSPTTISKYLKELVFLNLISVQKSGFNRSNTYKINDNPFNGVPSQQMETSISKNEVIPVHKMEHNKINLKISNKNLKKSLDSEIDQENGELNKSLSDEETNIAISNIIKSMS